MWTRRRTPSPGGRIRFSRFFPWPPASTLLFVAVVLVGAGVGRCFLFVNVVGESMPRGVYLLRVRPPGQPPSRLVLFCLPDGLARFGRRRGYLGPGLCPGGGAGGPLGVAALVKPVVARAGDRVRIAGDGVRVGGRLLANSAPLPVDSDGQSVPPAPSSSFVVPPGHFLAVSSHHPRSWDGRYWGPLPASLIRGPATLILSFEPQGAEEADRADPVDRVDRVGGIEVSPGSGR